MIELESPQIEPVEEAGTYAKYEAGPLQAGYGVTLGNALRRVLLSSLEGAAVTSIQIRDIYQEFSTIPGVKEDVTQIVLNVKKLRLKSYAAHPVQLRLIKSGAGAVTAADIAESADVEIVNPDLVLMTLDTDDVTIEMDLTVERGVGYLGAERAEALPIGVIAVDAIFTPVRKINYWVESMRVGQMTNYDKLTIEIETDGTIAPGGGAQPLGRDPGQPVPPVRDGRHGGRPGGRRDRRRRAAGQHAGHADRGARPPDAGVQLAQAQQHRQGRPAAPAQGRRPAPDAQLRQEVARRDEGAPAHARLHRPRDRDATASTTSTATSRSTTRPRADRWPHRIGGRKLSRKQGPRLSLFKNLTVSVIRYERVKTTEAKAKEISGRVEKMITLAKRGDLSARRAVVAQFPNEPLVVAKLFDEIAPKYADRTSGFTRIVRLGQRRGDAAEIVQIELV